MLFCPRDRRQVLVSKVPVYCSLTEVHGGAAAMIYVERRTGKVMHVGASMGFRECAELWRVLRTQHD